MKNFTIELNHYEFVRVSGVDTASFLQGQISANMDLLSTEQSLQAALCNLKGRVIADFRVLKQGDDCLLQTFEGMAETIIQTLSKYAVFSKVALTIDDQGTTAIGLIGEKHLGLLTTKLGKLPAQNNQQCQAEDLSLIRIDDSRFELWFHTTQARDKFLTEAVATTEQDPLNWAREDLLTGVIHISPQMSEEFTPQLLNYDISGFVDFTKGCYTGQEVVARMFYRGKAKKRMFLASCSHKITKASKLALVEKEESKPGNHGEILGFINSQADAEERNLLLAVLNISDVEAGAKLKLSDQQDSLLEILPLPYTN